MAKAATKFFNRDGERCQMYHETVVTRAGGSGAAEYVRCYSGGWKTSTTKARINDALRGIGAAVYSDQGEWFVRWFGRPETVPFAEGIKVLSDGVAEVV